MIVIEVMKFVVLGMIFVQLMFVESRLKDIAEAIRRLKDKW